VIKVELLFSVIVFAVWIFTLIDVIIAPDAAIRALPKVAWVIVVLLFPLLGSAAWFIFGRPDGRVARPAGAYERSAPTFPEYDKPGRAAALDPDKDEEFLRQVRARADEQRRRYEQQKKHEREQEQLKKQQKKQEQEKDGL
jgi:Phospholipase_D-nuclease N-terminal